MAPPFLPTSLILSLSKDTRRWLGLVLAAARALRQAQGERVLAVGACLLLAGCSQEPGQSSAAQDTAETAQAERTDCALGGAADYRPDCTVERSAGGLVIRAPGGGFRRFETDNGDDRIRPADGAEAAQWRDLPDGRVEVAVGQDRYRLKLDPVPASSDAPST